MHAPNSQNERCFRFTWLLFWPPSIDQGEATFPNDWKNRQCTSETPLVPMLKNFSSHNDILLLPLLFVTGGNCDIDLLSRDWIWWNGWSRRDWRRTLFWSYAEYSVQDFLGEILLVGRNRFFTSRSRETTQAIRLIQRYSVLYQGYLTCNDFWFHWHKTLLQSLRLHTRTTRSWGQAYTELSKKTDSLVDISSCACAQRVHTLNPANGKPAHRLVAWSSTRAPRVIW